MSDLKLGRLAATRPFGLSDLSVYAKSKLPKPPASVTAPVAQWNMDMNDSLGDCTVAGVDHLIAAWNIEFGETDPRPDDETIEATYFSLTGGADAGCNEANVLKAWQTEGLFGNKIAAYAPVNPKNLVELHQVIAFYGGAYLGIACPASAQEDFAAGKPWAYDPYSPIEGGHCIVAVGYSSSTVQCVSWGSLVEVSYPFLAHYLEEAWCVVSNELVEKGADALGLDLAALKADLP